jgi:sulfopyruvate decarboxylase subunit alpha
MGLPRGEMISAAAAATAEGCLETLQQRGFDFFCGVADSTLASLIKLLSIDPAGYQGATREDLAVGMASGAFLAGRRACVLMQNSGLGYCLNALTSLNLIYRIPLLLIVGYRGYEGKDAPEHRVMGTHCEALLREVGIPALVPSTQELNRAIEWADQRMREQRVPAAVFIRPGILG